MGRGGVSTLRSAIDVAVRLPPLAHPPGACASRVDALHLCFLPGCSGDPRAQPATPLRSACAVLPNRPVSRPPPFGRGRGPRAAVRARGDPQE